jgi:glutaredoxin
MNTRPKTWIREALFWLLPLAAAAVIGIAAGRSWRALGAPPLVEPLNWQAIGLPRPEATIMISAKSCPVCDRARRFLSERDVEFIELDVEQSERARELAARLKVRSVPTFLMASVRLNGFEPDLLLQQLEPARDALE